MLELIHPSGEVHLTGALVHGRLLREIRESTQVSGVVLLGLDTIVEEHGNELPKDVCVCEEAVAKVVEYGDAGGKRLCFGASIHPNRADACERLERVQNERHAVLVKWVPSSQRIDPANGRYE